MIWEIQLTGKHATRVGKKSILLSCVHTTRYQQHWMSALSNVASTTGTLAYLSNRIDDYTPPSTLRSCDKLLLSAPRVALALFVKAFSVSVPSLWNSPSSDCSSAQLASSFQRSMLKTELFDIAYTEHSWLVSATMRLRFACDIWATNSLIDCKCVHGFKLQTTYVTLPYSILTTTITNLSRTCWNLSHEIKCNVRQRTPLRLCVATRQSWRLINVNHRSVWRWRNHSSGCRRWHRCRRLQILRGRRQYRQPSGFLVVDDEKWRSVWRLSLLSQIQLFLLFELQLPKLSLRFSLHVHLHLVSASSLLFQAHLVSFLLKLDQFLPLVLSPLLCQPVDRFIDWLRV